MKLYSINIKGKEFKVALAADNQTRGKGLSGLPKLGATKGMLFAWEEPTRPVMVMTDMNFDLDFLFLDKDFEIVHLGNLTKDDTEGISPVVPVNYVLELTAGTIQKLNLTSDMRISPSEELLEAVKPGVKKYKDGGSFELVGEKSYKVKESDIKADPNKLQILDGDGFVVANIEAGARIFSRPDTENLIQAYKDGDKLALAKLMVSILDKQDNQKPDYVRKDG